MVRIKSRLIFHLTHQGRLLRKTKICSSWYLVSGSLGSLIPTLAAHFVVTQNHRKVWVRRNLEGHLVSTPSHRQGHCPLDQVAQGSIQPGLGHYEGWGISVTTSALLKVFHKPISIHIATEQQQQQQVGSSSQARKANLQPVSTNEPSIIAFTWTTSRQRKRFTQGFSTGPDPSKIFLSILFNLFVRSPISHNRAGTQWGASAIINSVMSPTEMQFLGEVFRDHTYFLLGGRLAIKKKSWGSAILYLFFPHREQGGNFHADRGNIAEQWWFGNETQPACYITCPFKTGAILLSHLTCIIKKQSLQARLVLFITKRKEVGKSKR